MESDRRLQREFIRGRIGQIERARIGVESLGDELDDISQGLTETVRSRNDLGDIGQQRDAVRNGESPAGGLPEQ
jgi:hypothetical protein